MTRSLLLLLIVVTCSSLAHAGDKKPPIYLWLEPEWFEGVEGHFAYWTGKAAPTGHWGIAGPGISAEWSQGGESEWNSMGVPAAETKASCHRDLVIPRAGTYKVWVRYVDHRNKTEPFRVSLRQKDKDVVSGELGVQPVVPPNDEYQLFWDFSFGWGVLEAKLEAAPARLTLSIDKEGEAWRQLDAVLITDDAAYVPVGREKPAFQYYSCFDLYPSKSDWRGTGWPASSLPRKQLAGKEFTMWTGIAPDPKWWNQQDLGKLSRYDVLFQFSPPADIKDKFHKQFADKKDVPIVSWPHLVPGFHLGGSPDFSPGTPLRTWFEKTKTPFFILTNYANPKYSDTTGPATYAALTGPLADQFLGFIHGEAIGTPGVNAKPPEKLTRREHVDTYARLLRQKQTEGWSKIFKTPVKEGKDLFPQGISCLSVDSIALAHLFHHAGAKTVGYEIDATNVHAPMRIAFERGAARQYGGAWINYASGNFGDACNYFSQNPVVNRGAGSWFHSKYAVTDGVSIAWYRKLYYLNHLGGASAIYWEQNLANQWILPGPGTHPIQLSPFGRATEDFQNFVDRLPDRGEPYTPIAFLLSYGHAYERVNYHCKMLNTFTEDANDLELRELFNVAWFPSPIAEGQPASPDVQSMPGGVYGNIFDVIVDRPEKSQALQRYPVVWAAGDADLAGLGEKALTEYLERGGTLVVNIQAARKLPAKLLGLERATDVQSGNPSYEEWLSEDGQAHRATPFHVMPVELKGARVLAWAIGGDQKLPLITRHQVGKGAVIVTLVPHMLGVDERAHPALPYLMNGLTRGLVPIEVRRNNVPPAIPGGEGPQATERRLEGEILYQFNKTQRGYLVTLVNTRGIDKTQNGIARVDRRATVDVILRTSLPIAKAREWTQPRELAVQPKGSQLAITLQVSPGDVQVVELEVGKK